jgi:hypothetical protein
VFALAFISFEILSVLFGIFHGLDVKTDVTFVRIAGFRICKKKAESSCKVNFGDFVSHQTKWTAMYSLWYTLNKLLLKNAVCFESLAYPGGVFVGFKPPRNSEVLKKLGQIPSFVEYTSVTT